MVESDSESPPSGSQNGHAAGNQPGARDLRNAGIDLLGAVTVNVSLPRKNVFFYAHYNLYIKKLVTTIFIDQF